MKLLMCATFAAGTISLALCADDLNQVMQQLQVREERLVGRQLLWKAVVKDFITEEHKKMMTGILVDMVERSPNAQLTVKPHPSSVPSMFEYTTYYQICRSRKRVSVRYTEQSPVYTDKAQTPPPQVVSEVLYYSEGNTGVFVEQEKSVQGKLTEDLKKSIQLRKEAMVARYSQAPHYLFDSFQRTLRPPDFAILAGTNPLKIRWEDTQGWTISDRTSNSIVLECEGAPVGLGGQRTRLKVWLRIDKGYCPSRIEMWYGEDTPEFARRVPHTIWNVSEFTSVDGVWIPKSVSYELYPQPDTDAQGRVYSRWGRWEKVSYRLMRVGKCDEPQLTLPDDVRVADFRLGKADMVIGYYDKGVAYKWGDFGRLATEAELKQLFAKQYPDAPHTPWWRTALLYAPPVLLILGGVYWLYRRKRLQPIRHEP